MSDSSVKDYPVIYFGINKYKEARDTKGSPYHVISDQVGPTHAVNSALDGMLAPLKAQVKAQVMAANRLAQSTWPQPAALSLGSSPLDHLLDGLQSRLRCVVVNALHDSPIIAQTVYANHSYQSGQPVVPNAKGVPQRVPEEFRGGGQISHDWIDAPPKNFASVGAWAANRPEISFYGTDIGVTLSIPVHKTILRLSLIQSISKKSNKFRADLFDDDEKLVDDDDYYDKCDDSPLADDVHSKSFTLTKNAVKVTVRTDTTSNGVDLYAFVEAA